MQHRHTHHDQLILADAAAQHVEHQRRGRGALDDFATSSSTRVLI